MRKVFSSILLYKFKEAMRLFPKNHLGYIVCRSLSPNMYFRIFICSSVCLFQHHQEITERIQNGFLIFKIIFPSLKTKVSIIKIGRTESELQQIINRVFLFTLIKKLLKQIQCDICHYLRKLCKFNIGYSLFEINTLYNN